MCYKSAQRAIELVYGNEIRQFQSFIDLVRKHILVVDPDSQFFLHTVPRSEFAANGTTPQMFVSATLVTGSFLRLRRLMHQYPAIDWPRLLVYDTTFLSDEKGLVDHLVMKLPGDYVFPVAINVHFRNESTATSKTRLYFDKPENQHLLREAAMSVM